MELFLVALFLACLCLITVFLTFYIPWRRERTRLEIMSRPVPDHWRQTAESAVTLYPVMPEELRERLLRYMQVFIEEKNFETCGGLELTEEMKVTIAAVACMLLIGRTKPSFFPTLTTILIYPSEFCSGEVEMASAHVVIKSESEEKLGESWHNGTVILSWDHIINRDAEDGSLNLVAHEFAHQLDEEDGFADGMPDLGGTSLSYGKWRAMMAREYRRFLRKMRKGKYDPIDEYGATDQPEFFAVATETFFENPIELQEFHPNLYTEFSRFYGMDPLSWIKERQPALFAENSVNCALRS